MKRAIAIALAAAIGLVIGYLARGTTPHVSPEKQQKADAPEQLWTCGMHPQVIRKEPGFCPICGMALTPLEAHKESKLLTIDPAVVQNMGVRLATAEEGAVRRTIRTVGYLAEAQPNQHEINLRVNGWIDHLYADTEGMHIAKGDPLFDLYSPELQVGIEELIAARRAGDTPTGKQLTAAAERKLQLLGLMPDQIDALAKLERAPRTVTFRSPVSGHLIEKLVVDGSSVKAGDRALRIVDHSRLWLDAQVHEQHLPFVRHGQQLSAQVDGVPGRTFEGQVMFIHPHVEEMTRTAMVRAWIDNPALELRPGMYATVNITAETKPSAVLVPREAVIDTGERQVVFLARDAGAFEPRQVTMGVAAENGMVEILDGLAAGDIVVTSGQFLLDAESRFREAIAKFQSSSSAGGGAVPGPKSQVPGQDTQNPTPDSRLPIPGSAHDHTHH